MKTIDPEKIEEWRASATLVMKDPAPFIPEEALARAVLELLDERVTLLSLIRRLTAAQAPMRAPTPEDCRASPRNSVVPARPRRHAARDI